jgi:hypothetical protein
MEIVLGPLFIATDSARQILSASINRCMTARQSSAMLLMMPSHHRTVSQWYTPEHLETKGSASACHATSSLSRKKRQLDLAGPRLLRLRSLQVEWDAVSVPRRRRSMSSLRLECYFIRRRSWFTHRMHRNFQVRHILVMRKAERFWYLRHWVSMAFRLYFDRTQHDEPVRFDHRISC